MTIKQIESQEQKTPQYFLLNNELNIVKDNSIQLDKDREAVYRYFIDYVNPNTVWFGSLREKLDYLVREGYIKKDLIEQYDFEFIKELYQEMEAVKFRFSTFMGAYKFYSQYAMKTKDGKNILERYEDRIIFNALELANGDEELAEAIAYEIIYKRYQPATPTFLNAGKVRAGEKVSCFLLSIDDDMNSIGRSVNSALQLSKLGGGVGINLTDIRPSGDPIKGLEGMADGVVPIMKMYEDAFTYANQLGARSGAGVVYLNIFHKDVVRFLATKKENADEKVRVKTLSLGLVVPDKFYELIAKGRQMYLFSPYDILKEYGVPMSEFDITEHYDELVDNPNIRKDRVSARELENEISKLIQESGYPYIINIDTANRENPVYGIVKMSNLCVTGDTELLTDKGYVRADELYKTQEELNVAIDNRTKHLDSDEKGISLVSAIPMQLTAKQADVYEIKTKQGFTIKSTEWHKYYVQKEDGEIVKIPMADLKVGDKLLVQSDEGSFGNNDDIEVAYLMGLITGDGTLSKNKNGISTARIVLHGNKSKIKNVVEESTKNVIKNYELQDVKHNASLSPKFKVKEQGGLEFISMDSGLLGRILDEHFNFTKENKLEIPQYIKNGTKEVQSAYLSGLYQMDGTVNANKKALAMTVELSTISEILVKDIQKILLNLGIYSTIYEREAHVAMLPDSNREYVETKCRKLYKISIQDREAREKFFSLVTLKDEDIEKVEDFNSILSEKSRNPKHKYTAEISSIEFYGVEDVYDTTQEDYHSLIFNGIVTGNCTEILQVQSKSILNDDQTYKELGTDVSCNLGSTNVDHLMQSPHFGESVVTMFRALTQVANSSNIKVVPTVKNANDKYHSVGLGAMNLHGYLAKNKIMYGSPESIEFTGMYFQLLNYWTLYASNLIAKETGQTFFEFDKSEYANGKYFEHYIPRVKYQNDLSDTVADLFSGIEIPTQEDWKELQTSIELYGLYNSYRLAVAPTGSIAYINESTASIHPIIQKIEKRSEGKRGDVFYPAPYLSDGALPYYESAYAIDQRRVIDVYAEAQKHVDQALSMTIFMDADKGSELYEWKADTQYEDTRTTRDINILRNYAWTKGIKSIYYVRTYRGDAETNSVNECESCSI